MAIELFWPRYRKIRGRGGRRPDVKVSTNGIQGRSPEAAPFLFFFRLFYCRSVPEGF